MGENLRDFQSGPRHLELKRVSLEADFGPFHLFFTLSCVISSIPYVIDRTRQCEKQMKWTKISGTERPFLNQDRTNQLFLGSTQEKMLQKRTGN